MAKKLLKKTCSKCSDSVDFLNRIDKQTIKKLEQKGVRINPDNFVCRQCFDDLISKAYVTGLEKKIQIQIQTRYKKLWNHRVEYLKKAQHASMNKKNQEALKNYQIYLKIMQEYYEVNLDNISPKIFVSQKDNIEKNIMLTVFFELVKIFDTIKAREEEFYYYLEKVNDFLPGSSKGRVIVENLKKYAFSKTANHKVDLINTYKKFKKEFSSGSSSACYIATVVFDNYDDDNVKMLRSFRDDYLLKSKLGSCFVLLYYFVSLKFISFLNYKFLKIIFKKILKIIIILLKFFKLV